VPGRNKQLSNNTAAIRITKIKKPDYLLGNPAISSRPVAFRPCLSAGLAFSKII